MLHLQRRCNIMFPTITSNILLRKLALDYTAQYDFDVYICMNTY